MVAATRALDFLNGIGINVHVEYTDGKYANATQVVSDLAFLGVNHVRDATLNPQNEGQASYGVLADAGIKFDLIADGSAIAPSLALVKSFLASHPGSVSSIEGLNEVNNWPITYNGLTGDAAAVAYQSALDAAVKGSAALKALPVFNLTNDVSLAAPSDYANVHAYPTEGAQPFQTLADALKIQTAATGSEKPVLTEAGYYTLPNNVGWGGVDEVTQAKLTLNLLLDANKLGFSQTFLYQLLDAYSDPTKDDPDKHFGLFDVNNRAKAAATALHNLTTILDDHGAGALTFQAQPLSYGVSSMPTTGSSLLIEKSGGVYDVVLWNEPKIWSNATHAETKAPAVPVTVNLGGTFQNVNVYDPLVGTAAITTLHNASQVQLALTDHPLIVEVGALSSLTGLNATAPLAGVTLGASAGITLRASAGGSILTGGGGNDTLIGGAGNDTLVGGAGSDLLTGGKGRDVFLFRAANDSNPASTGDVISDFKSGDDIVDLHGLGAVLPAGAHLHFVGASPFSHLAGEVHYAHESQGIALSVDINGDGVADFVVHLTGVNSVTLGNLVL